MPTKKMRKVNLGFVDLNGDDFPEAGKDYNIVKANSSSVGSLPTPGSVMKLVRVQVINFYIEDLPDFTRANEAIIRFTGHTRDHDNHENKEELTFALEFNVKDRNYAPGFLERIIFRNVLIREYLELGFNLIELDQNFQQTYGKTVEVIKGAGLEKIDAINSIPYIKTATKIFDGLIKTFGKDSDDLIWSESPALYTHPAPGGSFLREGMYVVFEEKSIYNKATGTKRRGDRGKKMPINDLLYKDGKIRHKSDPSHPISNHLIFSVNVEGFDEALGS